MDFRRRVILCVLVPVFIAGCQHNHAHRELVERELRLQEDRIYELEAELESAHRELCQLRDASGGQRSSSEPSSRSPGVTPPSNTAPPSVSLPDAPSVTLPPPGALPSGGNLAPPSVTLPPPSVDLPPPSAPPFRGPPAVTPPDPNVPEGLPGRAAPPTTPPPATSLPPAPVTPPAATGNRVAPDVSVPQIKPMSSPKFVPPSAKTRTDDEPIPPPFESGLLPPPPADSRIHEISVGRATQGFNSNGVPGDDGVLIVVSARNAQGESVVPAAETTIVIIDPAVPGEGARYARWDFAADGTAGLYRPAQGNAPAGAYFELPWPDVPPAHEQLKLFVRVTTAEGVKLEAEHDLVIDLTSSSAAARRAHVRSALPGVLPAAAHGVSPTRLNWGRTPAATAIDAPGPLPTQLEQDAAPIPNVFAPDSTGPLLFPASEARR